MHVGGLYIICNVIEEYSYKKENVKIIYIQKKKLKNYSKLYTNFFRWVYFNSVSFIKSIVVHFLPLELKCLQYKNDFFIF